MTINENIIEVRNVSKTFKIYHEKRNTVFEVLTVPFTRKKHYEKIIVLDDVSFTVKRGEMVGIIGLNGSGKSTLLKLIAGIYYPDKGKIITRGSLIPFLELGAGFQPDLTAKENVILYGLILGFTKKEISKKAEEIIKFAELEKFADTKIKNFSSGMYARLAFATAVQVDPDILLVDEILSVGDLPFQSKSFETFMSFKERGKSIVLVSHNLQTVRELCDNAIFIHKGKIYSAGNPDFVINAYKRIVDNLDRIEEIRSRVSDSDIFKHDIDKQVIVLRPWSEDFSKFGINTAKNEISVPQIKNQKFKESILTSLIDKALSDFQNNKPTLLDMSCNNGYFTIYALKKFDIEKAVAIDNDDANIHRLKFISNKLNIKNLEVGLLDLHNLNKQEKFDIVFNINNLHMLSDPEKVLSITHELTKKYAIIQSVVSLQNTDEDYFETPAPGWSWGCRFSEGKIKKWIENLDWKIIEHKKNVLEYNSDPKDRGSVYFLCKKN